MTLKEQLIQDLDRIPDSDLEKVRDFLETLHPKPSEIRQEVWDAYQASKQEREEVYRRLANS